jgi:hypothetical protein
VNLAISNLAAIHSVISQNSFVDIYFSNDDLKRKLRMYSEKISLDLEEEKELEMQLGC